MEAARQTIKPGVSEIEVAAAAERVLRLGGSEFYAFATLVASGERAAYPHASPTFKKIKEGETVIVDLGARISGYCADFTRTFILGEAKPSLLKACEAVLKAREKAFQEIKPGIEGFKVDEAARKVLEDYGFKGLFIHGLGHGVGLEIHEPPRLTPSSNDKLLEGSVFTVEPGIYVSGEFGVRVEDTVHLTSSGVRLLVKEEGEELISML